MTGFADSGYPDQSGVTSAQIQGTTGSDSETYQATQSWDPQYFEQGTLTTDNEPRTDVGGSGQGFTVNGNVSFVGTMQDPNFSQSGRGGFNADVQGQQNFTVNDTNNTTPSGTITEQLTFNTSAMDGINREGSSLTLNSTYLNVVLGNGTVDVNVVNGATISNQTLINDPASFGTSSAGSYAITVVAPITTANQQVGFNYDLNINGQMTESMNYAASFSLEFNVSQ